MEWEKSIDNLLPSIYLPLLDKVHLLPIPQEQINQRTKFSEINVTIEPIYLTIKNNLSHVNKLSATLAKNKFSRKLSMLITEKLSQAEKINSGDRVKIRIDKNLLNLIEPQQLSKLFSTKHHEIILDSKEIAKDFNLQRELISQISPYFSFDKRREIVSKLAKGKIIEIEKELLPAFARNMVRKHVIYRGPNCFHAALAFQSLVLASSALINVKKEAGHHRSMINHDELWRILQRNFYAVDPQKTPIKYGDILVFFDLPEGNLEPNFTDFHWIRHAATYLFSGYTFSKGSKSPNTPYTIKTLDEEWATWKRLSKNLAVKVFRRTLKNVTRHPPKSLIDWLY